MFHKTLKINNEKGIIIEKLAILQVHETKNSNNNETFPSAVIVTK